MESINKTDRNAPTSWWQHGLEALCVAVLLSFVYVRCQGYEQHVDLHWADEFAYLDNGMRMLRGSGMPDSAWSPAYSLFLAIVEGVTPSDMHVFDFMYVAGRMSIGLACWWALRRDFPPGLAVMVGLWANTLDTVAYPANPALAALGNVYAFGFSACAIVVGLFLRGCLGCACVAAVAMVFIRGECAAWFLCAILMSALLRVGWSRLRLFGAAVLAIALLVCATSTADAKERSWLAFRQHYAFFAMRERMEAKYAGRTALSDEEAIEALVSIDQSFHGPDQVIAEDFGAVSSIWQACAAAPDRVMHHFSRNAAMMLGATPLLCLPSSWQSLAASIALLAAGVAGVFVAISSALVGSSASRVVLACAAASVPAALPIVLLVGPKLETLYPATLAMLTIAMMSVNYAIGRVVGQKKLAAACGVGMICVALSLLATLGLPFDGRQAVGTPLRDAFRAIKAQALPIGSKVLVAQQAKYPISVMAQCDRAPVLELATVGALEQSLRLRAAGGLGGLGIQYVIWDRMLEVDARRIPWLKEELNGPMWEAVPGPGATIIYKRKG